MKKLFVILAVLALCGTAIAQDKSVEYPTELVMTVMPAPETLPPRYFQGYYIGWIEDSTDVLDGGWPIWMLDRADNTHTAFDYPYVTYLTGETFLDSVEASRIEYIINSNFVGQVAACGETRTKWKVAVYNDDVQEAIWAIYDNTPVDELRCPVDQIVMQSYKYALDWDRCGPGYRLHLLIPTTPWGGAAYPNLFVLTLFKDVPCEVDDEVKVEVDLTARVMEAK